MVDEEEMVKVKEVIEVVVEMEEESEEVLVLEDKMVEEEEEEMVEEEGETFSHVGTDNYMQTVVVIVDEDWTDAGRCLEPVHSPSRMLSPSGDWTMLVMVAGNARVQGGQALEF
ncbi:unnamed protein product [Gadus morhua 'NCC']